MRCLAVCQTSWSSGCSRSPAARLRARVLVESRPLARRFHDAERARSRSATRGRIDTYVKADLAPGTCVIIEDNGRREPAQGPRGGARRRRHARLRARHRRGGDVKRAEELRADFPEVTTSRWPSCSAAPLLTELGRSLTRARVQQYQRYFGDADRVLILLHNDPDPDAMASGLALRNVLRRTKQTAIIGAIQGVTRPENLRMVKLLDLQVETITPEQLKEFDQIALVDVQPHYFRGLLPRRSGHRSPSRAVRLQRGLQGHPPRLRLDLDDPHRAPARRRHRHLGAHRDGDALRDQVRHAVLQPPGQPRRPRRVLVPLSARRRRR